MHMPRQMINMSDFKFLTPGFSLALGSCRLIFS